MQILYNMHVNDTMWVCGKEVQLTGHRSGLRGLEVTFQPHDPSDAGSNPTEVVEFLRTEKFREQVLREGL
jgi:hypothetical protein